MKNSAEIYAQMAKLEHELKLAEEAEASDKYGIRDGDVFVNKQNADLHGDAAEEFTVTHFVKTATGIDAVGIATRPYRIEPHYLKAYWLKKEREGEDQETVTKLYHTKPLPSPQALMTQEMEEFSDVLLVGYDHEGKLRYCATSGLKIAELVFLVEAMKNDIFSSDMQRRLNAAD